MSATQKITPADLSNLATIPMAGNSGVPATPAAGLGQMYGIGTSNIRPGFMNESGTAETIQTTQTSGLIGTPVSTNTATGSITTTAVTLLTLTITITAVMVASGRKFKLTGFIPQVYSTVDTDRADIHLMEGATDLAVSYGRTGVSSSGWGGATVSTPSIAMPSAGSHTYTLKIVRGAGTGTLSAYAGAETAQYLEAEIK